MKSSVLIHAKFVADHPTLSRVYYFCRVADKHNQGWVHLHLDLLASFFGVRQRTAKRWLLKLKELGALRGLRDLGGGLYDVQLRAYQIIEERTCGWSVAAVEIPIATLASRDKTTQKAYEAAVVAQQERTGYMINKKVKDPRKVLDPRKAYTSKDGQRKASKTVNGLPNVGRGNNFFLKSTQQAYGASLTGVQHQLDKSAATVHKHTKHLERINVWKRTNDIQQAHYVFMTRGKNGYRERYYKQLPSFFLTEQTVKLKAPNPQSRTLKKTSPTAHEETFRYLASIKKPQRRSMQQVLNDLTNDQVKKLAWWITWVLKGIDGQQQIDKLTYSQLRDGILVLDKQTEDEQTKKLFKWLARQIRKGRFMRKDIKDCWRTLKALQIKTAA